MTAYDRWLTAPYAESDPAQDELDHYSEKVTEDEILAVLDPDNLACAHSALADSAHIIGKLLKMPTVMIALTAATRAALESLSVAADTASDERETAIEKCAKKAIADHDCFMERE